MIESYSFGRMVIDGALHTADVIIYPDGTVQSSWWRREGHRLDSGDIKGLIDSRPDIIIAGTGASGMMKPVQGLKELLAREGIDFLALPSKEAMARYNDLSKSKKVGACFHLTC